MLRDFATLHDVGVSTGMPATASLLPPPFSERFSAHCATRPERLTLQSHALLARVGLHDIPTSAGLCRLRPPESLIVMYLTSVVHFIAAALFLAWTCKCASALPPAHSACRAVPCRAAPCRARLVALGFVTADRPVRGRL